MEKGSLSRNDIHIVSRNSNWAADDIQGTYYSSGIYAGRHSWKRFLHFFLLGLGVAFTVAGVIFFFAFNWAGLHRFAKIGIMLLLVLAGAGASVLYKGPERIRNIFLTGAAMMVGGLFAVFGQVYQTGANAYDFFLGWTCSVFLWTLVSGFPLLWFLFLLLCNTTLWFYQDQVASWDTAFLFNLLFLLNALFLLVTELAAKRVQLKERTGWVSNSALLAAVSALTIAVCTCIAGEGGKGWGMSLVLILSAFPAGLWYGFRSRNIVYLAIIPYAVLIILIAAIIRTMEHDLAGGLLLIGLLAAGATTLLIIGLVKLYKSWQADEK